MIVLVLGPANKALVKILQEGGHQVLENEVPIDIQFLKDNKIDFAVSYGYRHIIKSDILNHLKDRIINLHISYLPWNRGADPNLWSFLEDTPKGVTIHYLDEGIDTGDIIAQKELFFDNVHHTLATTYARLQEEMILLFKKTWPLVDIWGGGGGTLRQKQPPGGTCHRLSDKLYFLRLLSRGWDTPVSEIIGQGVFYLREIRSDDREKIYLWRNSPDVAKYMYTDHRITEEEHNRWFDLISKDKGRKYWIIVYDKEEVGLACLYDIDEVNKRCCYASYIIREDMRGKGVGSLAEYYILRYLFEDLGFNKVFAEVLIFNKAGINLHKSMGFKEEGLYRQHRVKNGQFVDVVALAMLRSEWDENKPQIEQKLRGRGII